MSTLNANDIVLGNIIPLETSISLGNSIVNGSLEVNDGDIVNLENMIHNDTTTWSFNTSVPSLWEPPVPTTISEAIDRIAAAFKNL